MPDTSIPAVIGDSFFSDTYNLYLVSGRYVDEPNLHATIALFSKTTNQVALLYFCDDPDRHVPTYDELTHTLYIRLNVSALSTVTSAIAAGVGLICFWTKHKGKVVDTGIMLDPGTHQGPVVPPTGNDGMSGGPTDRDVPPQFYFKPSSVMWHERTDPNQSGDTIPAITFGPNEGEISATAFFHHLPTVGTPRYDRQTGRFELHYPISVAPTIKRMFEIAEANEFKLRCVAKPQNIDESMWVIQIETPYNVLIRPPK